MLSGSEGDFAVKTRGGASSDVGRAAAVADEALMLEAMLLNGLRHPGIVTLLAMVTTGAPVLVCTELLENGDLRDYLRACRPGQRHRANGGSDANAARAAFITPSMMVKMAAKLSSAMAFLEHRHVIHRDVAARNVLVGKAATDVKLADLGAARNVHRTNEASSSGVYIATTDHAPARWMPLEALQEAKFSHKSDVFAFGVLLWEILTLGQTPWGAFGVPDFTRALAEGKRLAFPLALKRGFDDAETHSAAAVYAIAVRCWNGNPAKRPHFHQLEAEFAVHCTVQAARARATATAPGGGGGAVGDVTCSPAAIGSHLVVESANVEQRPVPLDADRYVANGHGSDTLDVDGYVADMHGADSLDAGGYVHNTNGAFGQRVTLDADGYVEDYGAKAARVSNRTSGGDTLHGRGDRLHGNERASNVAQLPGDFAQVASDRAQHSSSEYCRSVADYAQLGGNRTHYVSSCEPSSIITATIDAAEAHPRTGVAARSARKPSLYLGFGQHPPNGDNVDDDETRL
jgi:hypothetical protein